MTIKNILAGLTILSASVMGQNCTNTHNLRSQKKVYKSIYIDQFKLTYFRLTLIKSYNNSSAIQEIISSDHSGFTEPILTDDDYRLIDSLAIAENDIMKIDSAKGNQRAEGAQGKRPLGFILHKLNSKWLDSIANKRYKNSGIDKSYND